MSNLLVDSKETTSGFWKRLSLAIEAMSESHEEQLENRVSRLEVEVALLAEIQKMSSRPKDPESDASLDLTQRR